MSVRVTRAVPMGTVVVVAAGAGRGTSSTASPAAPAIASALGIGEETVKTHVSNILSKLHLADRTQAAIYGLQRRLVPLEEALE